jgi:hypothetical protein
MDGGGSATLNGWSLDVTEVPEPTTWGLIGFGVIFSVTQVVRWWLARREII